MRYRIILDKNLSLKDKETNREVMIHANKLSIVISEQTLKYIKDNYLNNIIEVQEVEKTNIISTTKTSNILQQASNNEKDIAIKMTNDTSINNSIEKTKNNLFNSIENDFNISNAEINNIINLENDIDRIFINHDDGEENIVKEKIKPKKLLSNKKTIKSIKEDIEEPPKKKKINKKTITKKITLNKKKIDKKESKKDDIPENLDIDAVLDFFSEDDPYDSDTKSITDISKK